MIQLAIRAGRLPLLVLMSLPLAQVSHGQDVSVELAFITHLDADLPEQDVYIERVADSGKFYRVTKGDHNMAAQVYRLTKEQHHDPFDPDAVGPYEDAVPLGFTLGDWLKHQGTGTYTCTDGVGALDLSFTGLVPNGIYTMWHAFVAIPPPEPFTGTLDLPLGARDGSESMFVAEADGSKDFRHTFEPCLQMSDTWTTSMLAINYHSDGNTWGGHPGHFGKDAHIPLFVSLPLREGVEAPTSTE